MDIDYKWIHFLIHYISYFLSVKSLSLLDDWNLMEGDNSSHLHIQLVLCDHWDVGASSTLEMCELASSWQTKSLKLEQIMNEKMSKRRIQIIVLQKQEIEEKEERRLLITHHIFYEILLINLWTKNEN